MSTYNRIYICSLLNDTQLLTVDLEKEAIRIHGDYIRLVEVLMKGQQSIKLLCGNTLLYNDTNRKVKED